MTTTEALRSVQQMGGSCAEQEQMHDTREATQTYAAYWFVVQRNQDAVKSETDTVL